MSLSDEQLLHAFARGGGEHAFQQLAERYLGITYGAALRPVDACLGSVSERVFSSGKKGGRSDFGTGSIAGVAASGGDSGGCESEQIRTTLPAA